MKVLLVLIAMAAAQAAEKQPAEKNFSRDVFPIVQKRCQNCHRPGEVAPMAFGSYKEVRPWAKAIRQAVVLRTMPPWHADAAAAGHGFRNDRSLSQTEIDTITAWVDQGAKEGPAIEYPALEKLARRWKHGEPDLVVEVPGFSVPATGELPYTYVILPLNLKQNTWIAAAEFNIDQRAVLHRINALVRPPGSTYFREYESGKLFDPGKEKRLQTTRTGTDRRELLVGYEPGYQVNPWGEGRAKLIAAGSDLVLELHFTANGKAVTDHSQLGLYFAKEAPRERVVSIATLNEDLEIPAGAPAHRDETGVTLARGVKLIAMQPHMHLRGKAMEIRATYPDGKKELLLSVPKYDFNWQTTYFLRDSIAIPAGTRLDSIAYFDNSASNKYNPDATQIVKWGDQSWEEMHMAFMDIAYDVSSAPGPVVVPSGKVRRLP